MDAVQPQNEINTKTTGAMTAPIIDPSTLSEEQREAIRVQYITNEVFPTGFNATTTQVCKATNGILEWLFGAEFFKKGE